LNNAVFLARQIFHGVIFKIQRKGGGNGCPQLARIKFQMKTKFMIPNHPLATAFFW